MNSRSAGSIPARLELVELPDDLLLRALQQIRGDLRLAEADALIVELAADDAEQGRLDLEPRQLRLADRLFLRTAAARGDERNHLLGHTRRHQVTARGENGVARLPAVHPGQTHAVFHDRRHPPPQAFEIGQEILAQGEDHPATLLGEIVTAWRPRDRRRERSAGSRAAGSRSKRRVRRASPPMRPPVPG